MSATVTHHDADQMPRSVVDEINKRLKSGGGEGGKVTACGSCQRGAAGEFRRKRDAGYRGIDKTKLKASIVATIVQPG